MKIIPMGTEFFNADRCTDGRTDRWIDGQTWQS